MSAFSFPYFLISYFLSGFLKGVGYVKDNLIIPPWDEYYLDDHESKMEFRWFKFFVYYQVYFLMMIVFVAYVQWNLYQLRTPRYKSSEGTMLITRTTNPYKKDKDYKKGDRI